MQAQQARGKHMPLKIMSVVGARPNFMKIAPFVEALADFNRRGGAPAFEHRLVHTGQHYDEAMSESFFRTLGIPRPDVDLGVGSGTHAEQVGRTMIAFEPVLRAWQPDWIVVVGDVNATCACSVTAAKEHIPLAHIEAGLRSFDRRMPEEINRLVTDALADLLFTTDATADANLLAEGVPGNKIRRVGNIMIDSLLKHLPAAREKDIGEILARYGGAADAARSDPLPEDGYVVVTLHRPSNVDDAAALGRIVAFLAAELARTLPVVWTLHPRTRKRLADFGLLERVAGCGGIRLLEPLGYLDMMRLNLGARAVLTDSGGLQEECCVMGTPCVTLRENTERPVTLRENGGVSELAGNELATMRRAVESAMGMEKRPRCPDLWDGHTAQRIVAVFAELRRETA